MIVWVGASGKGRWEMTRLVEDKRGGSGEKLFPHAFAFSILWWFVGGMFCRCARKR